MATAGPSRSPRTEGVPCSPAASSLGKCLSVGTALGRVSSGTCTRAAGPAQPRREVYRGKQENTLSASAAAGWRGRGPAAPDLQPCLLCDRLKATEAGAQDRLWSSHPHLQKPPSLARGGCLRKSPSPSMRKYRQVHHVKYRLATPPHPRQATVYSASSHGLPWSKQAAGSKVRPVSLHSWGIGTFTEVKGQGEEQGRSLVLQTAQRHGQSTRGSGLTARRGWPSRWPSSHCQNCANHLGLCSWSLASGARKPTLCPPACPRRPLSLPHLQATPRPEAAFLGQGVGKELSGQRR